MKSKEILIKKELFQLSNELGLKYNPNWFNFIWIKKEQETLTEYLSDCKNPIYERYGKTLQERIKNLNKFYNSLDYQSCIKRYGGQVFNKKSISLLKKSMKKITNKEILKILDDLLIRIKKHNPRFNKIALLTETKREDELKILYYRVLRHEWIHILLDENKIRFKNWRYNEGLVIYFEAYLDNILSRLEKPLKREECSFNIECFKKAVYFKRFLGDKPEISRIRGLMRKVN
ncbi:MAG: hypothetical protein BWY36_00462 [Candidatus Diapherotrites archaeon ADurb.Bin253]|jgi:hypothetical protein|nr:hypothetical protein [Candidatus Pacearchaeota archaeon]OQA68227.1 MAG: hypothetical protein BWY36_00462 [Candidatus Diapherotrites archaeon ADurb.Bin253]HNZ52294.1 hypothetical protein [Candidatus Pacearchaeota archaeon]HOC96726.1 hypothetical protein [Candidatus Pacearchaeota archaeon]